MKRSPPTGMSISNKELSPEPGGKIVRLAPAVERHERKVLTRAWKWFNCWTGPRLPP